MPNASKPTASLKPSAKKGGPSNLSVRFVSSLVLIPLVLGAVWLGGAVYNVLLMLALLIGLYEWMHLTAQRENVAAGICAAAGLLLSLMSGIYFNVKIGIDVSLAAFLALFYFTASKDMTSEKWVSRAFWVSAAIPYLAWPGLAMIAIRNEPNGLGLFATAYLLAVVWATDSGAYAAGVSLGGPKILPQISPKKTWAGLIGGMALAAAAGYGVARWFGDARPHVPALVALGLAVVSQIGDFFESYVKRRAGAKDSGTLIPGHGGLLDRIDGLLFASVAMAVLLMIGRR